MAASPWVAHEFSYTITISGNDREAIFSDCVWSVRSCEGSLKKRGHCLTVNGLDARALIAPLAISGKLSVRRTPTDQLAQQSQPRAVLRVANRGNNQDNHNHHAAHDLEPFLQDLQNDVARLSRAFATLGFEAEALRSEADMRVRLENLRYEESNERTSSPEIDHPVIQNNPTNATQDVPLTRNARRRMRQRLRAALNETAPSVQVPPVQPTRSDQLGTSHRRNSQNGPIQNNVHHIGYIQMSSPPVPPPPVPPPVAPPSASGSSNALSQNGNVRANKKKRRHRK